MTDSNAFAKLCRLAGECVVRYKLIEDGDKIAVGTSGGKDSFALLFVLDHLRRHAPIDFNFVAVTFNPGFDNFGIEQISEFCHGHNWEHYVVAADVVSMLQEKDFESSPCVLCSRWRRGKLYGFAKQNLCGKLALGQHLDDVIASFFMSLVRGQGISTMSPYVRPENPEYPAVIRPLATAPEELIVECVKEWNLPRSGACRYAEQLRDGDREFFRELTDHLARKIPDVRSNVLHSLQRVELEHLMLDEQALKSTLAKISSSLPPKQY